MTVRELFYNTLALMGENRANSSSYSELIIPNVNQLLADLFEIENGLRLFNDDTILTEIPTITSLDDTLTYNDVLTRNVLNFGLANLLLLSDDETQKANFCDYKYQQNKEKYVKGNYVENYKFDEVEE